MFDSVPGDEGYSPLRQVLLVSWNEDADARLLRSVEAITEAENAGEVTVEQTETVVNMPMLTWPGDGR